LSSAAFGGITSSVKSAAFAELGLTVRSSEGSSFSWVRTRQVAVSSIWLPAAMVNRTPIISSMNA
jgi:hypothetical protein